MNRPPVRAGRTRVVTSPTANWLTGLGMLSFLIWLASDRPIYLGIGVAIVMAVVVDAGIGWWALREVELDLRPPTEVASGVASRWDLTVSGWRRPFAVRPLLFPLPVDQLLENTQPASLAWPPMTRGIVPFIAYDVMSRGPLGLATAGQRMVQDLDQPVRVGPVPIETEVEWPRPTPLGFGPVEGAPVGEELFRSIRPYRRGDSRRKVHWKASAHHGRLMVLELDGTGAVRVRIVVELPPGAWDADLVAGVAASVAATALARGWWVDLVTLDGGSMPVLTSTGKVFGAPPMVGASMMHHRTSVSRVRTAQDVRDRLALATPGRPQLPARRGTGHVCIVSAAGVRWA